MAVIADIGAVLRLTPQDELHIARGDGVYDVCADETPFYFRVQGHIFDGQLFYGLFGPVLSGPSRYEGLICNILVRTDATDWRKETESQVNFKVGPGVVTRDHREHFGHPEGTRLEGFPCISRFGLVEVVPFDEAWRTRDVLLLARGIRQDAAFDRLPILADALQEAGCDNDDILDHCRHSDLHIRGRWVVDLVLGKE